MQFSTLATGILVAVALVGTTPMARAQVAPGKLIEPSGPARKRYLFAQKDPDCSAVANVTKNTDEDADITGSYTKVCYRSPAELRREIDELRKIHDWADTTYQRRLAALPAGGALVISIRRQGPKGADPAWLFVTVKTKEGQELLKDYNLRPGTGRFYGRDLYQIQQIVPFPQASPQSSPLTLLINDTRLRQLFEYTLTLPAS